MTETTSDVRRVDLHRALSLLVNAARPSPLLRQALASVEQWIAEHKWSDRDMHQAWEAGAQWACDRAEIEDGELFVPTDDPGIEGRDWADECGHWLNDFEEEW
jgi:hypothetical protein